MWEQGSDASLTIPGKYLQQISPEVVSKEREGLPGIIVYGFQRNELCNLAMTMFWSLAPEDVHQLVNT